MRLWIIASALALIAVSNAALVGLEVSTAAAPPKLEASAARFESRSTLLYIE